MKKTALLSCILLIAFALGINAQPLTRYIGVAPFEWNGDFWQEELGRLAAKEATQRLTLNTRLQIYNVDDVEKILAEAGIASVEDADPNELRQAFWSKRIRFLMIGEIEDIVQTRDVDGTVYVKITMNTTVLDLFENRVISSRNVSSNAKYKEKITSDTPWDAKAAEKLIGGAVNRAASTSISDIELYLRNYRGIYE